MSILNVNQIQPVGGGNTITVSASDVNFSGNISVGSNFIGIVTASTATVATNAQGLTGTPDIIVNNVQSGVVTATTFIGDGSGLTGVTASGSGINIKDSGSTVGVAATIDFSTNLNVSPASAGIVTVTVGDTDFEIADKIIHTGDTNTAIRFPADDTITAETGGSERLRITSTGSVGIGTISVPNNFNVEIANNGSTGLNLRNTNDSANDSCRIAFSQGSGNLASSNTFADIFPTVDTVSPLSGHIKFRTNEGNNLVERLRITSTGLVGIGLTNPQTITHIFGTNPILRIQDNSAPIADAFAAIQLGESDAGGAIQNYWQFALEGDSGTSTDHFTIKDGTGERLRITSGGNVNITDGNLVVASGHGIDFSATGEAGGMNNELLDDYEEGTWTPIFDTSISGGTLSGLSYDLQEGKYRKIGSMVYIEGLLRTTAVTNGGAGTYDISGLPFTASVDDTNGTFFCYSQHSWTNAPHHFGVVANTDHARARGGISVGDATYTNGNTNDFNTASGSKNRVYFSGWYTTV